MRRKEKGEITAFLSLIFVLLLSFIMAMTESAQIQTAKNMKRLDVDRAVYSVFGEYQKELLEEYEIFALDGSYETGKYAEEQILNRMAYYGSMGVTQTVTDIQLLTDNAGQAFREQVLEFMETRSGLGLLQDLTGLSAKWEEQRIQGEEVSDQLDEVLAQREELLPEEGGGLIEAKRSGILSLVLPDSFQLSGKKIVQTEMVSARNRNNGRGTFPARVNANGVEGKLLFEQYILEKFSSAVNPKSDARNLSYEIEYILSGKESDEENLKEIAMQMMFVRLGLNYMHLMTDSNKQGEADLMALALAAVVMHPEAKDALKQILLLLWAFGESVVDLRSLFSGRKIALVKTADTWQLPLSAIFTLGTEQDSYEGADAQSGMDYGQYLQILLFLKDEEALTMRTLDRAEQNLRFEKGLGFFRADACVTKIKLENTAEIWNGCTYLFPTYFGYL